MKEEIKILEAGVRFVRENPQIVYTLFLLVLIPLAFFYTSEQFLKVARENQDKLERSRIGLLQDAVATFLPDIINTPEKVTERLLAMREMNETITAFRIVYPPKGNQQTILASLLRDEVGSTEAVDEETFYVLGIAANTRNQSVAHEYYIDGQRYWRAIRAVYSGETLIAYLYTDISMSQADVLAKRNINNAYAVLAIVIIGIILLLFRHAKIIDYTTLYKRLKEVDQMKDDFVSMAAHELRSPLTVIRGYVDLLSGEQLSEVGKKQLGNIDNSAKQLNNLIGDILDVARLQEGRMSFAFTPVDVVALAADVVEGFMQPAKDKLLLLTFSACEHKLVSLDEGRLRQVLVNLIGNAVKYTPKGEVRVSTRIEKGRIYIRVSDTGMGISAEDQKHIFEKFFRVKNEETAKIQGTGLGLWITNQIVREMGGMIAIESIKGKGSDFIVSFPCSE